RAGPGQVRRGIAGGSNARPDVLTDERSARVIVWMLTVLTALAGTSAHLPARGTRDGITGHPSLLSRGWCPRPPPPTCPSVGPTPPRPAPARRPTLPLPGPGLGSRPIPWLSACRVRSWQSDDGGGAVEGRPGALGHRRLTLSRSLSERRSAPPGWPSGAGTRGARQARVVQPPPGVVQLLAGQPSEFLPYLH